MGVEIEEVKVEAEVDSDGSATLKLRYMLQTMNYNSIEALLRSLLWCEKKHVTYDVRSSNCFVAGMNHLTG